MAVGEAVKSCSGGRRRAPPHFPHKRSYQNVDHARDKKARVDAFQFLYLEGRGPGVTQNKKWRKKLLPPFPRATRSKKGEDRIRGTEAPLYPASKKQNQENHYDQAHTATRIISPRPAVRPSRQSADQQYNQDYKQNK